jgi:hypothetical protein
MGGRIYIRSCWRRCWKVLEGGLGFSQASTTVRLVCAGWKAAYDALVLRRTNNIDC